MKQQRLRGRIWTDATRISRTVISLSASLEKNENRCGNYKARAGTVQAEQGSRFSLGLPSSHITETFSGWASALKSAHPFFTQSFLILFV
ncbi:unnamed protein product [Acanthoscelides obtectus]|uniref:Uncharacterized protein n=1 Tax=Acanthoscelides obtectus TaxID=200917 RepID=A0A9P0PY60_ACAOB|nr:unnamed protein product [Acanthoscelides obtectus]CAK1632789.1 hypothetical protein AOBTE_LOCUS7730 [Acanthoscelides obtectus]